MTDKRALRAFDRGAEMCHHGGMMRSGALGFVFSGRQFRRAVCAVLTAALISTGLGAAPEGWAEALLCRVPAEAGALWYGVPLDREALRFAVGGVTFAVGRSCSAETFLALAAGLLVLRGRAWLVWAAWPVTLAVNSARVIAATRLTLMLEGFPYERLAHAALGMMIFSGALGALWIMSERRSE